jgi:hypothetical protein
MLYIMESFMTRIVLVLVFLYHYDMKTCSYFHEIFPLDFLKIYMMSWRLTIVWSLWLWLICCTDIILGQCQSCMMFLPKWCFASWLCLSSDGVGCSTDRFLITFYFQSYCYTRNHLWVSPLSVGCHTGLVFERSSH